MFHVKHRLVGLLGALCTAGFAATAAPNLSVAPEKVSFPSLEEANPTTLTGYLYKPAKFDEKTPVPAFVLAHGCSGMIDAKGEIRAGISHWAAHFAAQGYVVLAVDSFNPRGHKEICTKSDRPIRESRERPDDAYGGLKYLAAQPYVKKDRVFLMGFSNGATGSLYAVASGGKAQTLATKSNIAFRAVMAFYPGCTAINKARTSFAVPVAIFIGADDDWTPAQPCRELIALNKSRDQDAAFFDYPGAYHGFDVPGSTVRVRTDVRMSNRPGLASGVHVGGNDSACTAATKDVARYLDKRRK